MCFFTVSIFYILLKNHPNVLIRPDIMHCTINFPKEIMDL